MQLDRSYRKQIVNREKPDHGLNSYQITSSTFFAKIDKYAVLIIILTVNSFRNLIQVLDHNIGVAKQEQCPPILSWICLRGEHLVILQYEYGTD